MPPASKKPPLKALGKKAGPLPIWAWALLGAGTLLAVFLLLRRNTQQRGSEVQLVSGGAGNPQDAPSGGYPRGVTPAAQMLNDDVLYEIASGLSTLQVGQRELGTSFAEQSAGLKEHVTQTVTAAALQPPAIVTPTAAAAGSAPKITGNQPAPARYFTYKPGKAPRGRKADEAPKGKRLGFESGKGYYVIA